MTEQNVEDMRQQVEADETEDFDQFWAQQNRTGPVLRNVFGVDVQLPASMPLRFEVEARRVARSQSEDDTRRLVGLLFGEHALDRWVESGMDAEQFAVLLLWGSARVSGTAMTLAEARDEYHRRSQEQHTPGKAPTGTRPPRKKRGGSSKKGGR